MFQTDVQHIAQRMASVFTFLRGVLCDASDRLRVNLDPFGEHPDARIWEALAACGCARAVEHLPLLLDAPVHDGGCNFSHGERQLMCLARAVLARRRVVLIDEGLERSVDLSAGACF